MSTHFLEVSSLRDGLQEVQENARWLRLLLSMTPDQREALQRSRLQQGDLTTHTDDVTTALKAILAQCDDMIGFLDQFESAPVIYTGRGSTAEVIAMLERLISRTP